MKNIRNAFKTAQDKSKNQRMEERVVKKNTDNEKTYGEMFILMKGKRSVPQKERKPKKLTGDYLHREIMGMFSNLGHLRVA